jgi:hypothetical protein
MSLKKNGPKEPIRDEKLKSNFYFNKEGAVIQKVSIHPSRRHGRSTKARSLETPDNLIRADPGTA